jgi:hypothetical protein
MTTYLDGQQLSVEEGLDPRDLTLGPRITILGGGKAAQARGGSVRRVILQDACLTAEQARATYLACAKDHPAMGGKLVCIQVSPPFPPPIPPVHCMDTVADERRPYCRVPVAY